MSLPQEKPTDFIVLSAHAPVLMQSRLLQTADELGYGVLFADLGAFNSGERFCELRIGPDHPFLKNKRDLVGIKTHLVLDMGNDSNEFFVDAIDAVATLKENGVQSVHAIFPSPPYTRQDRPFEGRAVSMMAKTFPLMLKTAGADCFTGFDMHSADSEFFYHHYFGAANVNFMSATDEIAKAVNTLVEDKTALKVGAPDGADKPLDVAQKRACDMCHTLHGKSYDVKENMFGIVKRHRSANITEIVAFIGDVENADAIICDDRIDTGGTIANAAAELCKRGARRVIATATHAFCDLESLQKLTAENHDDVLNPIDHLIVTDSMMTIYDKVAHLPAAQHKRVTIVSTLPLIKNALTKKFC